MHTEALLSKRLLRRVCTLSIVLSAAILTIGLGNARAATVAYTYSLHPLDGGAYRQQIWMTPANAGDADFVFYAGEDANMDYNSGDPSVEVLEDDPLLVTIQYTVDGMGDIMEGPVELIHTQFVRTFRIYGIGATVDTNLVTDLSRKATGTLTGDTITWDNGIPYQEIVEFGSMATCDGIFCGLASEPWPRPLDGTFDVPLPTFTLGSVSFFGDSFVSDNGTPDDGTMPLERRDDIQRPAVDAMVADTWEGMSIPEPSGEILLLSGVLGLMGLARLRERGGVSAR